MELLQKKGGISCEFFLKGEVTLLRYNGKIDKFEPHTIYIHNPKWDELGKVAGFYRNTFIARDSDILIALVAEDRKGGTEDTLKKHKGVQIILQ